MHMCILPHLLSHKHLILAPDYPKNNPLCNKMRLSDCHRRCDMAGDTERTESQSATGDMFSSYHETTDAWLLVIIVMRLI